MKYYLFYIFVLFFIINFFLYYITPHPIENFTPKIREFYRPIIRKTRLIGEGFYSKSSSTISNLFRKLGLI
jgi:hypothetical protein